MIELRNISKSYGSLKVVDDLSLAVARGEITVLIGPSGCGKTTTLEMINGLVTPDEGEIIVDQENIAAADIISLRRRIGYVIQEIGLFPHYTVRENISVVPKLLKWDQARINSRIEELLGLVNLGKDVLEKYPHQLSGGQQQRVGVARALAADPQYLLMDEPFGAIDPINRVHLQDEFLRIQNRLKKTVVFVTHDMDEALKMGERIAVMNRGRLLQYDSPLNILRNPAGDFIEQFVGSRQLMKTLSLLTIADLPPEIYQLSGEEQVTAETAQQLLSVDSDLQLALEKLLTSKSPQLTVVDKNNIQIGLLTLSAFKSYLVKGFY
ncbi:MAG: ABC transporter ATP-binding protein [Calditrichia bacterium]